MTFPPNYRSSEKFTDPCCQNCLYIRTFEVMFTCVKHFCYVERSKVCDDHEDGEDYRFGLEFRPTTKKEFQLLKIALKGKKAPRSSSQGYKSSKDEENFNSEIEEGREK